MFIYSQLNRKDSAIDACPCYVEKAVTLTGDRFRYFKEHLLSDQDFIQDNAGLMFQSDDHVMHCLLVLSDSDADGILVESEGFGYARYTAFVPDAKRMYQMEQQPHLSEFNRAMLQLTEKYARKAVEGQQDGRYRIPLDDIRYELTQNNIYDVPVDLLGHMLSDRPEIGYIEEMDDEYFLDLSPEYTEVLDKGDLRTLTPQEVEIMCAKHTLWLNDAGGEQADFSNCLLTKEMNLSRRCLNNAKFDGARFEDVHLGETELCFASLDGAQLYNCSGMDITAEEASFRGAKLVNCTFDRGVFTHSNFTGAQFIDTAIDGGSLQNCCVENANLDGLKSRSVNLSGCVSDEQDWKEDVFPVLSM